MMLKKKKQEPKIVEKPVVAGPKESATLAAARCGRNNYPPKLGKWGSTIERGDIEDIIEMWSGQGSIVGRNQLLTELLTGLTESQVWEIYTIIRDVGCLKGRESVHKAKLHRAIAKAKL